jgi:8-oxo-dGTP diphosphatase
MELFDIIDENGRSMGFTKERSLVHRDGDWHKGVHVWVVNDDKLLLQKRSTGKDSFPDCYDVSCGGHVSAGDDYEATAIREIKEELGLKVLAKDIVLIEERRHITEDTPRKFISREILRVYLLRKNFRLRELTLQESEVSEVRLFSVKELRELLKKDPVLFTPSVSFEVINKLEQLIN